ncbi:hypothetical protein Tco_0831441 [Tanacetum coccineum]
MTTLPRCYELRRVASSPEWEDMFTLYCRKAVSEDLRLAREINALCAGLTAVIEERENIVDKLDVLVNRFVPEKMAEFMKESQGKDTPNLMKLQILVVRCVRATLSTVAEIKERALIAASLGGGVPVFQEEDDAVSCSCSVTELRVTYVSLFCTATCALICCVDVENIIEGEICDLCLGLYFSTISLHGCPVILSADGLKKVAKKVVFRVSTEVEGSIAYNTRDSSASGLAAPSFQDRLVQNVRPSHPKGKMANTQTPLLQELSRAADSHDIRDQLSMLFLREVAEDSEKMHEYRRLSSELRQGVKMRAGYINELEMSDNSN